MNIEDFIRENKPRFNDNALPEGHRERFIKSLRKSGFVMKNEDYRRSEKTLSLLTIWYSVAAAAVVTIAVIISGFDFGKDVFSALIALFGTPVAVASAIMAEAMDNDGDLAGQLVVWTSLVSLFSLFIIIFVVRAFGLL